MENGIKIGDYVVLKEDPSIVYKVKNIDEKDSWVDAITKNGVRKPISKSDLEIVIDLDLIHDFECEDGIFFE